MTAPLDVDGARPAVARVAAIPRAWDLTPGERLVLLALAADSFDGIDAAPGTDNLAHWTGMLASSVAKILTDLTKPTTTRPALLERVASKRGRERTTFRLLLEPSGEPGLLITPQPSGEAAGFELTSPPQPSGDAGPLNISEPSGHAGGFALQPSGEPSGEPSGHAGRSLSLTQLPRTHTTQRNPRPRTRAHELVALDGRQVCADGNHTRLPDGSCAHCEIRPEDLTTLAEATA